MSQFINDHDTVVTEAIDGTLRTAGGRLARLDGYPHIKVVIRADWTADRVALVSGGGSGHEPAHAGFVGRGMLTAAVCGNVFASPSVDAVLAALLSVTGDAGSLLIIKNYTGDRLNFGLAVERARALGRRVNMVIVDDDIALPALAQSRGLAGTLFVHKIAGAMAEAGESLETVTEAATRIVGSVRTIGMSLDTCTVPGSPKESRIAEGQAELGLGIHNEPGVDQVDFQSATQAVELVAERLSTDLGDSPHALLLNNLGGTTNLEMAILADAFARSTIGDRLRWIVGPAPLMTSLDMQGFSATLLPLTEADEAALQTPVEPPAWPGAQRLVEPAILPLPDGLTPPRPDASPHPERREFLEKSCKILLGMEQNLNALDAKSGDGDTGSTLAGAARTLQSVLDDLPLADETMLLRAIGAELAQSMGGSSGVLLAIFFSAAGDAAAGGAGRVDALRAGLDRMREVGGADPGDRTMIDALLPALDALEQGLSAAADAARKGADATAGITRAGAGRSTYVSAKQLAGHNDPGAEAVARLFEQLAHG